MELLLVEQEGEQLRRGRNARRANGRLEERGDGRIQIAGRTAASVRRTDVRISGGRWLTEVGRRSSVAVIAEAVSAATTTSAHNAVGEAVVEH